MTASLNGDGSSFGRVASIFAAVLILPLAAHAAVHPVTFNAPRSFPVGAAEGVAAGDFNGDGIMDVVALAGITNVTLHDTVSILLGDGAGGLKVAASYPLPNTPSNVAVADFNGDGKLDLVIGSFDDPRSDHKDVLIFLGKGDGTFRPPISISIGFVVTWLAVGDFNNDGKPDIVTLNCTAPGSISILLGKGDGTFKAPVSYTAGDPVPFNAAVAAADFNRDGKLDLVVLNQVTGGFSILLGNGDGSFAQPVEYPTTGYAPAMVAVADFDGDGKPDLALSVEVNKSLGILVMLGKGDGTFREPAFLPIAGCCADYIAIGDFNGDRQPDLAISGPHSEISILLNAGRGKFEPAVHVWGGSEVFQLAAVDLNGDGVPDLVGNSGPGTLGVLLGSGNGSFQQIPAFATGKHPSAAAAGDFNGDGKPDLAVTNLSSNDVSILLGNGDGTFQRQVTYPTGAGPSWVAVSDLNGDGRLDLVIANTNSTTVSVLLGNGDGTFRSQVSYTVGASPHTAVVGDLNGDGIPDIAVAITKSGLIAVLLGNGDGSFQKPINYPAGGAPYYLALTDFNGDGKLDIAAMAYIKQHHGPKGFGIATLLGNGDGTFQAPLTQIMGSFGGPIAAGDFSGSGKPDIVTVINFSCDLLLGLGDGTFEQGPSFVCPAKRHAFATGDFNADGHLDIAAAGDNLVSLLIGQETGTPVEQFTGYAVGTSYPWMTIATADFNGDGKLDLAVPNFSSNSVSVLINTSR